jgi:archaellum biogenesis protein FlaJ (TadC family)
MNICQGYASLNRELIAETIIKKLLDKKFTNFNSFHRLYGKDTPTSKVGEELPSALVGILAKYTSLFKYILTFTNIYIIIKLVKGGESIGTCYHF